MKLFYKKAVITWKGLHTRIDRKYATAYEIRMPELWQHSEANECKNVIRLWNELKYGRYYQRMIMCGEFHYEEADLTRFGARGFLYKIDKAVGNEKEIVLALDDSKVSEQLLEYFIKLRKIKGFCLHVFMNLDVPVRDKNERFLLTYLNDISQLDSVTFFNHSYIRDTSSDEEMAMSDWEDSIRTCEEIFAEEVEYIIPKLSSLSVVGEDELWLFNWDTRRYELITIEESDNKMVNDEPSSAFEIISPNMGKETCQELKEHRIQFKLKHGVKNKEEKCTFTGECKGTCDQCDKKAKELWMAAYSTERVKSYEETANVNGIIRLRDNIDGPGIRSLIVMNDCHLQCRYCINKQYINVLPLNKKMSVHRLSELIIKDAVYYEMTGGGVTFGGGEPLLSPEFIVEFKNINPRISIAVETSLNVPFVNVASVMGVVDYWIVDIKDMNEKIYKLYTGRDNVLVLGNLKCLINNIPAEKIKCRVPSIVGYNSENDIKVSVNELKEMGIIDIECFEYLLENIMS